MVAAGMPEVLLILLLLGGPLGTDTVAMVDPAQYFATRKVELSIDNLAQLAGRDPKEGKTQLQQLLALRYLAEHGDDLKKSRRFADHRQVIEAIAAGKQAQDGQGFAREYAGLVLARLDGKTLAEPPAPKLLDAFTSFPADVHILAGINTSVGRGGSGPGLAVSEMLKQLPGEVRSKFFEMVEKVGNVRVDQLSIAFRDDPDHAKAKAYIRIKGKANPAWLIAAMKDLEPGLQSSEKRDAGGGAISLLQNRNEPPVFMILGDTEMLIVGYNSAKGDQGNLVDQVLAVRAGKEPNATAGTFKARLKKIPARAMAVCVGDLGKQSLGREAGQLLGVTPARVDGHVVRLPVGYDVNVTATMANEGDAQTAVQKLSGMRKEGIAALRQMLKQPAPGVPVNGLINLLESLQMQAEGEAVRVQVLVPRDLLQLLPALGIR